MRSLYISQQGCYLSLKQEQVIIKQGQTILEEVQIPLLEQILVFGQSQLVLFAVRLRTGAKLLRILGWNIAVSSV